MYGIEEQYFGEKRKYLYDIIRYCKHNCPYYKKAWSFEMPEYENFDYKFFTTSIPILEKNEVVSNTQDFLADGVDVESLFVESTSGSEGIPLICYKSQNEKLRFTRDLWNLRRRIVKDLSPQDKMVHFFVSRRHMGIDEKNIRFFYEENILQISLFDLSEEQLVIFWREIVNFKPRWMHGLPSSVFALARVVRKYNLPNYYFEMVELTGEFLKPELEQYIRETFRCKVANEYGAREFWLLAYGCNRRNLHINDKNVYIETLNTGEILITGLQNYTWPLVRYKLGDKGRIKLNECKCKIKSPYILELERGRKASVCVFEDTVLSKVFFSFLIKKINMSRDNMIRQYQVIKLDEKKIQINIMGEIKDQIGIESVLKKEITERIPKVNVEIQYVDYIKPDFYTGKAYDFLDYSKKNRKVILCTLAPVSHRTSEENLGIGYLAAYLRDKGYSVKIIDAWLEELSDEKFLEILGDCGKPLLVGFSCYQTNIEKTIEIAKFIKAKLDIPILCGGFGPTFNPEYFLNNGIDYVIRGEGEEAIVELCDYLNGSEIKKCEIKNLSYRREKDIKHNEIRSLIKNLDDLPFPARDTMNYSIKKKSTIHLMTSRGCQGGCVFCSVIAFFRQAPGEFWRGRSIENIVDEIENLYKAGVKHIKIIDDSFIEKERNRKWCKKFADTLESRKIKMTFRASIRADRVEEEILKELKRAGFFSFSCGIENASKTALKSLQIKSQG